jgi:hypothetical protein
VFIVCAAIDYLRIIALERPGFRLLDKVAAKRLDRWDAWMNGEERADS